MNMTFFGCALTGLLAADPEPPKPPTPERVKELVKKLEEPIPPVRPGYPKHWREHPPRANLVWHSDEFKELERAGEAAVPALLGLFDDRDKPGYARAYAIGALISRLKGAKTKPDPVILAAVRAAMTDKDATVRWGTFDKLSTHGVALNRGVPNSTPPEIYVLAPEATKALLPDIVAALEDESVEVAKTAAATLGWFSQPKVGVDQLLAALKRNDKYLRSSVLFALGEVAADDPRALAAVLEFMRDKTEIVTNIAAISACARFGPKAKEAVPLLIEVLEDKRDPRVVHYYQSAAVHPLKCIGPDAKAAVPALRAYLRSEHVFSSHVEIYRVIEALEAIDPAVGREERRRRKQEEDDYKAQMDAIRNQQPPPVFPPVGKQ